MQMLLMQPQLPCMHSKEMHQGKANNEGCNCQSLLQHTTLLLPCALVFLSSAAQFASMLLIQALMMFSLTYALSSCFYTMSYVASWHSTVNDNDRYLNTQHACNLAAVHRPA